MHDNKYLASVIESIKLLHADDYVIVFNSNHEIIYATSAASRLIIGPKEEHKNSLLYGKSLHEIPHPIANEYEFLKKAMPRPSNVSLIMIENYFNTNYELTPGIVSATNRTLINPHTRKIAGYLCMYKVDPELSIGQLYKLIDHANFELSNSIKPVKTSEIELTPRQQHVLVLLLKNMSIKEIAAYLSTVEGRSISHMTIHNIVNGQLFKKFDVPSINYLQQKVIATNYHHKLLQSLLFKKLILIN